MNNNPLVLSQPDELARSTIQIRRSNSASPLVLQNFMQLLAELNHKMDALAARPAQVVHVKQVESKQVETESQVKAPEEKVDRKEMRSMFD
jgi:hypothetical protein